MKFLLILFSIMTISSTVFGICNEKSRIEFSFLNGVLTSDKESEDARAQIQKILEKNQNYLKVQQPTKEDLCVTALYNKSNGFRDIIETFGQKFKENSNQLSVPFSWKLVGRALLALNTLPEYGVSAPFIATLYADMIKNVNLASVEEQGTLSMITDQAKESLSKRSLVVISHSQGGLFANMLAEKLATQMPDRFKYYGNLQVGSAAYYLESSGDYYTSSSDIVINSLRLAQSVMDPNIGFEFMSYGSNSLSDQSYLGHSFLNVYIHPSTVVNNPYTSGAYIGQTAESVFLKKLENIAIKAVDHKCNEFTYPVPNQNGTWGYKGINSTLNGMVVMEDESAVCGISIVDAGLSGKIVIKGKDSNLFDSTVRITSGNSGTILLDNAGIRDSILEHTGTGHPTTVRDSGLFHTSVADSIIEKKSSVVGVQDDSGDWINSEVRNSKISNSITNGGKQLDSQIGDSTVLGSDIIKSTIQENSLIMDSKITSSNIISGRVNESQIKNSSVSYSSVTQSELESVTSSKCSFQLETFSGTCLDGKKN